MSFDSSRFTSNPWNNFFGVVMQQGRVQLDSDWNEWLAEFTRRIQANTLDIVGHAGVPESTPLGFAITITSVSGSASVSIGPGRMYVDGLLAENHGLPTPNPALWTPAANALPESQYPGWDISLDELVGSLAVDYNSQPYYPNAPGFPQTGGPYLIYLDVWEREVTFLDDPDLVEKAVGVDTTGRLQTVWQVKWLDVSSLGGAITCTSELGPTWDNLMLPPSPQLTTGVVQASQSGPCCLTSNSGYTGLENQLYRVQIHQSGVFMPAAVTPPVPTDTIFATFKWSRDNASVATGVTGISQSGTQLTVQSTGKDSVLRFSPNDWVEITDDWLTLNGLPGVLCQVSGVSDTAKTITLNSAVSLTTFPVDANGQTEPSRHTQLTRWDQGANGGLIYESDGVTVWADLSAPGSTGEIPVPPPGTTLILEDGITVAFDWNSGGTPYQTGENWEFAARSADGTVEYLDNAPPRGIYHHYARLALVTLPSTLTDCRTVFPPLTNIQSGGCCCCSVTVGDGISSHGDFTDIQAAIDSLSSVTTMVEVCLLPGTYSPASTVNISRSNLTLSGCPQATVLFSGTEPVFQVDPAVANTLARHIVFDSLIVQAPPPILQIISGGDIEIRDCTFTVSAGAAGFAAVAQTIGLDVEESQFVNGGIWVVDGSAQVTIENNTITNAQGPGIGLGGLPTGMNFLPNTAGVTGTRIVGNRITGATNSGISTVLDTQLQQVGLGDVEDLLIEDNVITGCAQSAPVQPFSSITVAGILLNSAADVRIHDNEIVDNGTSTIPTCGIYTDSISNLDISRNRIVDNGVGPAPSNPGGPQPNATGLQVGIYGDISRFVATDTLTIRDNEVRMPAGPALEITGIGPMTITGNSFQSFGMWPAGETGGLAVSVINYGIPLELYSVALGALELSFSQSTPVTSPGSPDLTLMDGRTLFHHNQVTFVPDNSSTSTIIPCVFLTFDDLALQDNQFESTLLVESGILIHTFAVAAFSLRCSGNRFSEFPGTALLSLLGVGQWNNVNANQATHCIWAGGANTIPNTTNQIMGGPTITKVCEALNKLLLTAFGG